MTAAPNYSKDFMKVPREVFRALRENPIDLVVYMSILDRVRWSSDAERWDPKAIRGLVVGEMVFGRAGLAKTCNASESTIRTSLKRLERAGIIATRSTSVGTIATIRGYGEIAETVDADRPADQPADRQQIASRSTSESPADRPLTRSETEDVETKKRETHAQRERGPRKLPDASKADGAEQNAISRAIAIHEKHYTNEYGHGPKTSRKQRKLVAELVDEHGEAEVLRRIDHMFLATWMTRALKTLTTLHKSWDHFAEPDERGVMMRNYRARYSDDAPPPLPPDPYGAKS